MFVTFIENQTGQKLKRLRINQSREFRVQKLEAWKDEKRIKIKFNIVYFLKINKIAKKINSLIINKAYCLLFDCNLDQSLWPKVFDIVVYLLNGTSFATLTHNIPLKKIFKAYHNNH